MWKKKKTKPPSCLECVANPGWHESGAAHPTLAKKVEEAPSSEAVAEQEKATEALANLAVEETAAEKVKEEPKYTKRILKKGDKETFPKPKDAVKVNYTGKLADGKVFDTTWKEHKKVHVPLQFKVGTGRVIKGWDECLLTMSVGEKAEVTIEPEWAYGKKGSPPQIPPNATLVFEMELVSCGF
eukprot:CAMPEP_0118953728 /NCGR_PEP_ID=MMETSP1169-20130426/57082_1 /TAXON_ID=36882 /ORGANISM="Pyramimonas obovata, Strain CCMP722" /LENGTH=183 /DNA_ID=CAMNT_0006901255 /DNA_START=60 /DNA_END=611 /DNA_ORIENTATION=+